MAKTLALSDTFDDVAVERPAPAKPSLLQRLHAAMVRSREKAAQREIERFIMLRGGTLTDDIEREIGRRYGGGPRG
ncbi:MAG: hypothetical protein F9K44_05620 [Hyphomicrobiaceae bacterium]|nr:MAG: hypothetical protein F9K44_05620 [Hyphomicrobiaceae bacterium]